MSCFLIRRRPVVNITNILWAAFHTKVRRAAFLHLYTHFWLNEIGVKCWWNWPQIIQASLICNRFFIISSRFITFFSIEITLTDFWNIISILSDNHYQPEMMPKQFMISLSLMLTKIIQNWNWKENDKLLSKRSHFLNKKPRNLYFWRHENIAIKN